MFRNIITSVFSSSSQTYVSREGLSGDKSSSTHNDGSWDLDEEAEKMDDLEPELTAEEVAAKKERAPIIFARNQLASPLLRLPAELRNKIYSYLDLGGNTIEVLLASSKTITPLTKARRPKIKPNPNPQTALTDDRERLFFRLEIDHESPAKRRRLRGILALFALPQVCSQLRLDTSLLIYQLNTFAFTDDRYNYATAFNRFLSSLTLRQRVAIPAIAWPLRQAQEYHRLSHGLQMRDPDRDCEGDFANLPGLRKVTLRWVGTDVDTRALEESEREELEHVFEARGGWDYRVEREFRRNLAVKAMKRQVGKGDRVEVECVHTWRKGF